MFTYLSINCRYNYVFLNISIKTTSTCLEYSYRIMMLKLCIVLNKYLNSFKYLFSYTLFNSAIYYDKLAIGLYLYKT